METQNNPIIIYFNSWGGSFEQSLYLRKPLEKVTLDFYHFTIQKTSIGGFDGNQIPMDKDVTSEEFRDSVIKQTQQMLKQIVEFLNTIFQKHKNRDIVFLSHSFGYTLLYSSLYKSRWRDEFHRIRKIILLDPAGQANSPSSFLKDVETYGNFIKEFQKFNNSMNKSGYVFTKWKHFIQKSTDNLYTPKEKLTGMHQYIRDCFYNSPLTLCVFAYGVDFWYLDNIIKKYSCKSIILTSTNGIAINKKDYWNSLGINDIKVISNSGHFLHIFSQKETIEAILKILDIPIYRFYAFGLSYNYPLMSKSRAYISNPPLDEKTNTLELENN